MLLLKKKKKKKLTFHRGWARLLIERTALLIRKDIFNADQDGVTDEEDDY